MSNIKQGEDQAQLDNAKSTDSSLLESTLFLMTSEQREHFLESSSSKGIVYVNKAPCFDHPLSVVLTWKAQKQLIKIAKTENQIDVSQSQKNINEEYNLELKANLEEGVRLSGVRWAADKDDEKEKTILHIQSKLFQMICELKIGADNKAVFKAINIKCTFDSRNANVKSSDDEIEMFAIRKNEESDDDVLIANEIVEKPSISVKPKGNKFYPHIKTVWHVNRPNSNDVAYFDYEAIEKVIWEIDNGRRLSGISNWARGRLRELADVVSLSQLATQYRYKLIGEEETSEGRYCKLHIDNLQEDVTGISLAYVYAEESGTVISHEDQYNDIGRLLKRRLRKPLVLKSTGYRQSLHHFEITGEDEMPSEGFLVDVGLESQNKKQLEAMRCLSEPKSIVHLAKLATLLGSIKSSQLEAFKWDTQPLKLFDEKLTGRQCEAATKAINTPDICLIQGPPGTGKTRVISEIVQQASKNGWKTLLVAPTHVAVDNVLERVGYEDSISPIRCANKDKVDTLPQHIQQYTYQQRQYSILIRSQDKVKEDIDKLIKEKMRLTNASTVLTNLSCLRGNVEKLAKEHTNLKRQLSSVEGNVQKEFSDKWKNSTRLKGESEKLFKRLKGEHDKSIITFDALKERIKQFKGGLYNNKDKTEYKRSQLAVDGIQGKALKSIDKQIKNATKRKQAVETKLKGKKKTISKAKDVLNQLGKGVIPEVVQKAIQKSLDLLTTEHDSKINERYDRLKKRQSTLRKCEEGNNRLRTLLKGISEKQSELTLCKHKAWWGKALNFVWWQSQFSDFEEQETKHNRQLETSLELIPELKQNIAKAQTVLEKSKAAKIKALVEVEERKIIIQQQLYQSRFDKHSEELESLKEGLKTDELNIATLEHERKSAQSLFEQESRHALESTKKKIRQELASQVKQARMHNLTSAEKLEEANGLVAQSQRDMEELQGIILQTIKRDEEDIELGITAAKQQIMESINQLHAATKQLALFMGEAPFEQPSEIVIALEKVAKQIERNEDRITFSESWLDCLCRNSDEVSPRLAKYINLVCATTIGIASDEYFGDGKPLEQKEFDLLIIDEAGKVTEPQFLVAATRAKKWVIVGDHKQLPPFYDRKLDQVFSDVNILREKNNLPQLAPTSLKISYFENLWNHLSNSKEETKAKARLVTLDVQRRMHPDLAQFISDMFYPNEYNSPDDPEFVKAKTLDLISFKYAITFIEVTPPRGVGRLESNLRRESEQPSMKLSSKTGYINHSEAEKVIEVLASLLMEESIVVEQEELDRNKDSVATIGIMSFYAGQVELIRKLIKSSDILDVLETSTDQFLCNGKVKVVVNTVDSYQGKECSVIILSFTRSNPYQNIGFVNDANRLNVAMSRARKKLILLGDTETLRKRASSKDSDVAGNDTGSIHAERLFFEKLVQYIEGRGEIKRAFHVWRTEDDSVSADR